MLMEQTETPEFTLPCLSTTIAVAVGGTWLSGEVLQQTLSARMVEGSETLLDCDGVNHLDACSLQLLLAFHAQAQSSGSTVRLTHVSAELAQWFGITGAASLLELAELAQES